MLPGGREGGKVHRRKVNASGRTGTRHCPPLEASQAPALLTGEERFACEAAKRRRVVRGETAVMPGLISQCVSPSPGTLGEGRGEGSSPFNPQSEIRIPQSPRPSPLPLSEVPGEGEKGSTRRVSPTPATASAVPRVGQDKQPVHTGRAANGATAKPASIRLLGLLYAAGPRVEV